jgi:hypothetical protein
MKKQNNGISNANIDVFYEISLLTRKICSFVNFPLNDCSDSTAVSCLYTTFCMLHNLLV